MPAASPLDSEGSEKKKNISIRYVVVSMSFQQSLILIGFTVIFADSLLQDILCNTIYMVPRMFMARLYVSSNIHSGWIVIVPKLCQSA